LVWILSRGMGLTFSERKSIRVASALEHNQFEPVPLFQSGWKRKNAII
jgi:hypothetical protein